MGRGNGRKKDGAGSSMLFQNSMANTMANGDNDNVDDNSKGKDDSKKTANGGKDHTGDNLNDIANSLKQGKSLENIFNKFNVLDQANPKLAKNSKADATKSQKGKRKTVSQVSNPGVEPRFISGMKGLECARCYSDQFAEQAIKCQLCRETFHTSCRTRSGTTSDEAICAPSYVKNINMMIDKTGWGQIMFLCKDCHIVFLNYRKDKHDQLRLESHRDVSSQEVQVNLNTCVTLSQEVQADLRSDSDHRESRPLLIDAEVNTIEDMQGTALERIDPLLTNGNDKIVHNDTESIKHMLKDFKEAILNDVGDLVADKLRTYSDVARLPTAHTSASRLRKPVLSSDSSLTIDSGLSSATSPPTSLRSTDEGTCHTFDDLLQSTPLTRTSENTTTIQARPSSKNKMNMTPVTNRTQLVLSPSTSTRSRTEHIVVLRLDKSKTSLSEAKTQAIKALKNVPINSMNENSRDNKIVIYFPSSDQKVRGKNTLKTSFENSDIKVDDERKMFPKVTVVNIPSYLISHISPKEISVTEYRNQVNACLREKFMEKNETIRKIVETDQKTFEIVYTNQGYNYITAGIKVSPIIRNLLVKQEHIFIGETRCKVVDRLDLKQCFKCQKLGHVALNCKESLVCMYCSGAHVSRGCPHKESRENHRCRNCSLSENPAYRENCHTHNSSEQSCPIIKDYLEALRQRTEYSKNL